MKITKEQLKQIIKEEVMLAIKEDGIESGDWDVLDPGWGGHVDQFPKFGRYGARKEAGKQMKPSPQDYEATKDALDTHDDFVDIDTYNEMIKGEDGSIDYEKQNPRTVVVAFVSNFLDKRYAWVHLLNNPNEYWRVPIGSSGETAKSLRRESKITKEQLNQIIKEETLNIFKENNDWYDDEHESFADLKSDPKLHQSFDEDPDALSQLASDNSSLAWHAKLEDRLQKQLERGEITRQDYNDIIKAAAGPKKRTIMKALGQMKEASEELDNFNEGKLTDKEKAYKKIPDKHLNKAGNDKKDAIQHK